MGNFISTVGGFAEFFWGIVSTISVDTFNVIKNMDDFLFNYTSASGFLLLTFILAKRLPKMFGAAVMGAGRMKTGFQNFRARRAGVAQPAPQPMMAQTGGALPLAALAAKAGPSLAKVAQTLAKNPALRQQVAQAGQTALQNPQLAQQLANVAQSVPAAGVVPTAPAPVAPVVQQPVAAPQPVVQPVVQPIQPVVQPVVQQPIVQQPIAQPKVTMRQRMIPVQQAVKKQGKSNLFIFLMLFVVYAIEHYDDCKNKAGGSIDVTSFMRNGFWTIGFSYILTMIFTNIGPYRMIKAATGETLMTEIIDGIILYLVYNLVRNFRNITKKNTCEGSATPEKTEGFEETPQEELEEPLTPAQKRAATQAEKEKILRFATKPTLKELEKGAKIAQQDKDELRRSNEITVADDKIQKAQKILKQEDIIVGRRDVFRAVDKLLQEQKEINSANLKSILDVESPRGVKSTTEKEKVSADLPKDRRALKIPEFDKPEAGLPPSLRNFKAKRKDLSKTDDIAIRSKGGRLIGVNLEKAIASQNKKIAKRNQNN